MGKPKNKNLKKAIWTGIFLGAILAALILIFNLFRTGNQNVHAVKIGTGLSLMVLATYITGLLFLSITAVFGVTDFKKGYLNFLIGDNGTYSLSRLQAVLWALVIIAYQIGVIVSLLANNHGNLFSCYTPVFSETATWLLGLSLSSYIAVKGISTNTLANNPAAYQRQAAAPAWKDVLVGANGLDFSKCQMLLWTLIAIVVFESKCYYFSNRILFEQRDVVIKLMGHFYDEYNAKDKLTDIDPFVPFLPWSFIVLMGLSQGVYVGKKLVPTFKLDDLKTGKVNELQDKVAELNYKKQLLSSILAKSASNLQSDLYNNGVRQYKADIDTLQEQVNDLNKDIAQINIYLNPTAS